MSTMPGNKRPKLDAQSLKALNRAQPSAPPSKPEFTTNIDPTQQSDAALGLSLPPPKPPTQINARDLKGLKYFNLVNPLLEHLHECGTQRDRAGNRILHYDQYAALVLLFYFNPIIKGLRGITQASQLERLQKELGCSRASLGSLSEAARVFDSELLREIIGELAHKALPITVGKEAEALRGLTAVDGSLLPALPKMAWALWQDDEHRAAKMHVHFDVFKGVPMDVTVTHGSGSENQQLRNMLLPKRLYVIDRGYAEYQLFQDMASRGQTEFQVNLKLGLTPSPVEKVFGKRIVPGPVKHDGEGVGCNLLVARDSLVPAGQLGKGITGRATGLRVRLLVGRAFGSCLVGGDSEVDRFKGYFNSHLPESLLVGAG